jgi:hypothetical protein
MLCAGAACIPAAMMKAAREMDPKLSRRMEGTPGFKWFKR